MTNFLSDRVIRPATRPGESLTCGIRRSELVAQRTFFRSSPDRAVHCYWPHPPLIRARRHFSSAQHSVLHPCKPSKSMLDPFSSPSLRSFFSRSATTPRGDRQLVLQPLHRAPSLRQLPSRLQFGPSYTGERDEGERQRAVYKASLVGYSHPWNVEIPWCGETCVVIVVPRQRCCCKTR